MKHRRAKPEDALHRQVAKYLDLVLCKGVWWTSIAHGEGGGLIRGAQWKARGAKAGVPDILIISNGIAHWVELKAEGKYAAPVQKECHEAIRSSGAHVATCRSIDDIAESLAQWCIETREKRRAA